MAARLLTLLLTAAVVMGDGEQPGFTADPNTTKYCSFWFDSDGSVSCREIVDNFASGKMADFLRWNPSITPGCGNLHTNQSYCVEASKEPQTTTSTTSVPPSPTTTTMVTSTTTKPSNGITTPTPTQPGMVDNCNKFHYIYKGNTCDQITSYHGISQHDFAVWNPAIGEQCAGLLADAYACVGVIGGATTTSTPTQTTTSGIATPQPTQPNMVKNCNKFHYIYKGNTCDQITSYHGISQHDFATWNPEVGEQCAGLLADEYACVGVSGDTPTPTTTASSSSGVSTPQPTQPNMVKNCNKFHYIYKGNTCDQITSYHGISQHDFATWNPEVGEQCTGLWADYYACVGVGS